MQLYGSIILIKTFYGKNINVDDDDLRHTYINSEIKLDLPVEMITQISESLRQFIDLLNLFM